MCSLSACLASSGCRRRILRQRTGSSCRALRTSHQLHLSPPSPPVLCAAQLHSGKHHEVAKRRPKLATLDGSQQALELPCAAQRIASFSGRRSTVYLGPLRLNHSVEFGEQIVPPSRPPHVIIHTQPLFGCAGDSLPPGAASSPSIIPSTLSPKLETLPSDMLPPQAVPCDVGRHEPAPLLKRQADVLTIARGLFPIQAPTSMDVDADLNRL
jgi:hypothetical protein